MSSGSCFLDTDDATTVLAALKATYLPCVSTTKPSNTNFTAAGFGTKIGTNTCTDDLKLSGLDRSVDRAGVHHMHGGLASAVDPGIVMMPNHANDEGATIRGSTIMGTCMVVVVPRGEMV